MTKAFSIAVRSICASACACLLFLATTTTILADACEDDCTQGTATDQQACLSEKTKCLQAKISNLKNETQTLTSTIAIINGDISIQELKIRQKNTEITILEEQLADIDQRLTGLTVSLDRLSTLLLERVRAQYRQNKQNSLLALLSTNSLAGAVTKHRYLAQASTQTAQAMAKAETQRIVYDSQKQLKEEKQLELTQVRKNLETEKQVLVGKKAEKQRFLTLTQNDEKKFQDLLRQAEQQLASFRQFVSTQGGASILSGQTQCDDWGCYYNQRDSGWGNQTIGLSRSTMAEYGCLVTSMAMMSTHLGKSLNPLQITLSSNPFYLNTAYMVQGTWTVNGVSMTRTRIGYSRAALDSELANNRAAIIGIGKGPDHFLVVTKKEGDIYIMRDPYTENGKDIPFTDKYSLSSISAVDRITAF